MFKQLIAGALAIALSASTGMAQASRRGGTLQIGAQAPTLSSVEWIKGEPASEWKPGHVYVLDFWATWCGPCVASIPHVTELQKQYQDKNVHVIGVAVWPRPGMRPTKQFVEEKGDAMAYGIAEDVNGEMARAFLESTESNGIPTAMVIDKAGKLAWIGHPMSGLDDVVERVVSGTYSVDDEVARVKAQEEQRAKVGAIILAFQNAQANSDWDGVIDAADKLLAIDPNRYGEAGLAKYYVTLVEKKDIEKATEIGHSLVTGVFAKSPYSLQALAWMIVEEGRIGDVKRDLDLAKDAAMKAVELSKSSEPDILDTLARVQFERGEIADAVATQQKAVDAADENPEAQAQLRETLEKYQQAKQ